jgi:hypothetical protein
MALVKGKFVDKDLPIQSNNDPVDGKDLARKSYVDQKAADEAAAAVATIDLSGKQDSLGTGTTSQFLRGDLTWQEVATSVGIAQTKVVSKGGSDVDGDGTLTKPYATIAAAMASITDAAPSKRYAIKVEAGAYTEGALTLKPNVFVIGDLKEAVRITASSVAMDASFSANSGADNRSGMARVILTGACNFDWTAVSSAAGKLYFTEVAFVSAVTMNGYNNAIAQAQFDSCQLFAALTISGINVGVFKDNVCFNNITLNQHPNSGMASILNATGGYCSGTLRLNADVDNFGRRCSTFLRGMFLENLIVDGPSAYADADLVSQGKSAPQLLNGGQLIAMTPRINHDLETQMLKPLNNNAHNSGDWGKQWFFNFAYVHASAGTDCYVMSAMENYDPAGDSSGKGVFVLPDAYGLKPDVNGGNIELETAAVSGTGVRGKVKVNARELDMSAKQIKALADGTDAQDAVTKSQLDSAISSIPAVDLGNYDTKSEVDAKVESAKQEILGGIPSETLDTIAEIAAALESEQTATGAILTAIGELEARPALRCQKQGFNLTAEDVANGYVDCAFLAAPMSMTLYVGGVCHFEEEDYLLSEVGGKTRITFIGDLVIPSPAALVEGDKVRVLYMVDTSLESEEEGGGEPAVVSSSSVVNVEEETVDLEVSWTGVAQSYEIEKYDIDWLPLTSGATTSSPMIVYGLARPEFGSPDLLLRVRLISDGQPSEWYSALEMTIIAKQ